MPFPYPARLALAASIAALLAMPTAAAPVPAGGDELAQARALVQNLLHDNAHYVQGHDHAYFAPLIQGQQPRATIVTCSDSRVHTHALDQTPDGDLFVVRNIGNQHATGEGSIEYGVRHLHTPVLMFIGHSACGAVKAAMGERAGLEPAIRRELATLRVPGRHADDDGEVMASVEANVHRQVAAARRKYADEVQGGHLTVIGAVYDFRDDYRQGEGRLVVVNVNGETDAGRLRQMPVMAQP